MEDAVRCVKNWQFNKTLLYQTRSKLYSHLQKQHFSSERKYQGFIDSFVNKFDEDTSKYRRCSVVGNGGILKNSGCGEEIDKADYIFRANLPYISNFSDDVGKKSNFTTFNPSMIHRRYHNNLDAFKKDLHVYNGYLMFSGPAEDEFVSYVHKNTKLIDMEFEKNYLSAIEHFWESKRFVSVTTGMLMFNLALTYCEEIHLFGFWPFTTDVNGNYVPYHYAEDTPKTWIVVVKHSMPSEFLKLKELHVNGVLRLHIGKC
ncbi:alpha-N-acetylneuraminide alpha-2,8-sialyltransferase-like [Saccoglossus kowalevskii]|uniref:Alpha-N-acetylneuraminide alpha-2,8-sialyltransferase-like n=1 Tax=Saccoglossus kowalevskii TaxID=10224 RepID=A0ABM0MC08_SACKO|nr:PREDICTED: alpha-N-acetylneuraminide alpha-2,8-sialyltransferase-like [Saccoglossus kowalevskii]